MTIKQLFKKHFEEILAFLERLDNFIIIVTDENLNILDHTENLSKVCETDRELRGLNLSSFLVNSREILKSLGKEERVFPIIKSRDGVEVALRGFVLKIDQYHVFLLEQHRLTYNELIIKLSKLNKEVMVKTRELARKNRELQEALLRVRELEGKDSLTGILNRRAFMRVFVKEIKRAKRYRIPLSLAILDLDDFKVINDTYGHEAGDMVLRRVCRMIERNIREQDIFARLGGEEFVLLFPHTNLNEAYLVSERLRLKVAKLRFKGLSHRITASFGITSLREEDTPKTLIRRADEALYEAKRFGKNKTVIKI